MSKALRFANNIFLQLVACDVPFPVLRCYSFRGEKYLSDYPQEVLPEDGEEVHQATPISKGLETPSKDDKGKEKSKFQNKHGFAQKMAAKRGKDRKRVFT